eukprot:TRINITY_DN15107_c0_g1_i2.p3 TRINITY_DN15107_c0_g1~~TRINITY_DN15107_c0_g1_i2.p3  ORF type:complete len:124 (-),score=12.99 TRINITY_DN15107_c0_g1_i2:236-607(-)
MRTVLLLFTWPCDSPLCIGIHQEAAAAANEAHQRLTEFVGEFELGLFALLPLGPDGGALLLTGLLCGEPGGLPSGLTGLTFGGEMPGGGLPGGLTAAAACDFLSPSSFFISSGAHILPPPLCV